MKQMLPFFIVASSLMFCTASSYPLIDLPTNQLSVPDSASFSSFFPGTNDKLFWQDKVYQLSFSPLKTFKGYQLALGPLNDFVPDVNVDESILSNFVRFRDKDYAALWWLGADSLLSLAGISFPPNLPSEERARRYPNQKENLLMAQLTGEYFKEYDTPPKQRMSARWVTGWILVKEEIGFRTNHWALQFDKGKLIKAISVDPGILRMQQLADSLINARGIRSAD